MRNRMKILALSLALMIALLPVAASAGVISVADAVANGREVNTNVTVKWHNTAMLDEQTNAIIGSLLNSMEFKSRFMQKSLTDSYGEDTLLMQGQPAITIKTVTSEEGVFVVTPLLPEPVAVANGDETTALVNNIMAWLNSQGVSFDAITSGIPGFDAGLEAGMTASQTGEFPPEFQAVFDAFEKIDTTALEASLSAWAENALTSDTITDIELELINVKPASAAVYQITKDELVDFIKALQPVFTDFDPLWEALLKLGMIVDETNAPDMNIEEALQILHGALDVVDYSTIPDDLLMYYAECYDAEGEVIAGRVHFMVPETTDDAAGYETDGVEFCMDWLSDFSEVYALFNADNDGFEFNSTYVIEATEPVAGQTGSNAALNVGFAAFEDGEYTGTVTLAVETAIAEGDAFRNTDSNIAVVFDIQSNPDVVGLSFVPTTRETYNSSTGDVTVKTVVDVNLISGDEILPLATLNVDIATGEPQNPPIDLASDILFFHPGALDEAGFIEWMNTTVITTAMQSVMGIMALLPPEVMQMLNAAMTVTTEGTVEAVPAPTNP